MRVHAVILSGLLYGSAVYLGSLPLACAEAPYATYTFGSLEGKRQMTQDRERLYCLTTRAGELRIYDKEELSRRMKDIGQPPPPVGRLKLRGVPETLDWTGPAVLCIGTGHHLALVDVSQPAQPQLLSELPVAAREVEGTSEVRRFNKHLYVAARGQGLLRFDVSDPRKLVPAGSLRLRGSSNSVDVEDLSGRIGVVATGIGLAFVDTSGPELKLLQTFDTLRETEIVRLMPMRILLEVQRQGLDKTKSGPLSGLLVTCSKEYTTVWNWSVGITAFSSGEHPSDEGLSPVQLKPDAEVSTIDPFYFTHLYALEVTPTHVYVAGGEGGLYVYKRTVTNQLERLIQYSFWGTKERFTEEKKTEYVKSLGLAQKPREARRHYSLNENNYVITSGMAVDGSHVYLMDFNDNLWCLEIRLEHPPSARCMIRP